MAHDSTDGNLLFGVLALQADLLDAARFAEACSAWAGRKDKALADLLIERGWITAQDRMAIDRLVQLKLKKYAGDVRASLAAVATPEVQRAAGTVDDAEIRQSLGGARPGEGPVRIETIAYQPRGRERYTLTRLHARGGIGQVWLAHDTDLGREVALKELRSDRLEGPDIGARFVDEARITGQLEHPGIVPVYELVRPEGDGVPFYTMRFVRGRTLTAVIEAYHQKRVAGEAGPLDQRELLGAFVGVCNAVAYAHARGVVHRDLKGQNVVLGDFGEVMVLDWGLAKVRSAQSGKSFEETLHQPVLREQGTSRGETLPGQVLGTPGYMAPEQAEGRLEKIDERTDVYGLGAILYEVLTGKPPFVGGDTPEVLQKVIHERPVRPRDLVPAVPRALEAVCLKALAKNADQRYESVKALSDEVRHWLADEPVTAYRDGLPARLSRWSRRHKPLVAAAATLLVAAVGGLAATTAVVHGQQQETERQRDLALAERDRADRQQQETKKQKDRAVGERDRADRNFALIQKALEETTTRIADNRRLKEADFHGLRKELLATAVPFYQELAAQRGGDAKLEAARGQTYLRLAKVRGEMGRIDDALADLGQAEKLFRKLLARDPGGVELCRGLAECRMATGSWLVDRSQLKPAQKAVREAIKLWEQLSAEAPRVGGHPRELARSHQVLGTVLAALGRRKDSEAELRTSLKIMARLVKGFPASADFRFELASIHHNLGVHFYHTAHWQAGEQEYRTALRVRAKLVDEFPAEFAYRQAQAQDYESLAILLVRTGKGRQAVAMWEKALKIQEKLVTEFPALPSCRQDLAHTCHNLSRQVADPARKKALAERSLQIKEKLVADFPQVPGFRDDLARSLLGRADRLIAARQWPEAQEAVDRAQELQAQLVAKFPEVVQYAVYQGAGLAAGGELELARGRLLPALSWYDKAAVKLEAAIKRNWSPTIARPMFYDAQFKRAIILYNLARHAEAFEALDALLTGPGVAGKLLVRASAFCTFVTGRKQNASVAPEYAGRAMRLLTRARAEDRLQKPEQLAEAFYNLGTSLMNAGWLEEAMPAFRQALALNKHYAEAHCNLGHTLLRKGQFAAAVVSLRRGHELGRKRLFWSYPSARWVKSAERLVELDARLPALLRRESKPANDVERLELATLCQQPYKRFYAASARFWLETLTANPDLANLKNNYRYYAAWAAALAGCGKGEDAGKLDDRERHRLRRQALEWLRADLLLWTNQLGGKEGQKSVAVQQLRHWQEDPNLAGVRDPAGLSKLPLDEREAWGKLWAQIGTLVAKGENKS
jgi:serine/threonine-protein kinase